MPEFLLIISMWVHNGDGVHHIPFKTLAACEAAQAKLHAHRINWQRGFNSFCASTK